MYSLPAFKEKILVNNNLRVPCLLAYGRHAWYLKTISITLESIII
jgi:hypothetical protein